MRPAEIHAPTSRGMRERYLAERFAPLAERWFAAEHRCHALLLCVAQYWSGDADDAVHEWLVPCAARDPAPWPRCLEANPFVDLADPHRPLVEAAARLEELGDDLPWLHDDGSRIVAFASCTHALGDADDSDSENYRPYAIARRKAGGGVEIEVVGGIVRPFWEDRFDVLEDARSGGHGGQERAWSELSGQLEARRPRGWFSRLIDRLFGR